MRAFQSLRIAKGRIGEYRGQVLKRDSGAQSLDRAKVLACEGLTSVDDGFHLLKRNASRTA